MARLHTPMPPRMQPSPGYCPRTPRHPFLMRYSRLHNFTRIMIATPEHYIILQSAAHLTSMSLSMSCSSNSFRQAGQNQSPGGGRASGGSQQ